MMAMNCSILSLLPVISNTPEIGQLYVPEPSRAAQLIAGVAGLLGIAAWRARKSR